MQGTKLIKTIQIGYSELLNTECQFCHKFVSNNLHHIDTEGIPPSLRGYAMLVQAAVQDALNRNGPTGKKPADQVERMKVRKLNRDFAMHSKILSHFCDVFNLDIGRVRRAILIRNAI